VEKLYWIGNEVGDGKVESWRDGIMERWEKWGIG
jgi:hypothetical protein